MHARLEIGTQRDGGLNDRIVGGTGDEWVGDLMVGDHERLIGTLRRECLDHVIVVNEQHLRHVLSEFVRHYNQARPHQALELEAPVDMPRAGPAADYRVVNRPVLGGLTHEYEREAA